MMRDALIHLLAGVDGNESAEESILDHLYGRQADAVISAGWQAPAKAAARAPRPSGSSTLPVIAERIIEAPLTSACPTCGGLIGKYESVGLVDGEWVCAGCFTFDAWTEGRTR